MPNLFSLQFIYFVQFWVIRIIYRSAGVDGELDTFYHIFLFTEIVFQSVSKGALRAN